LAAATPSPDPRLRRPNEAQDLIDLWRSPIHSHYRKQLDEAGIPATAPFHHKIGVFLPKHLFA
jgi:hypothetical protein